MRHHAFRYTVKATLRSHTRNDRRSKSSPEFKLFQDLYFLTCPSLFTWFSPVTTPSPIPQQLSHLLCISIYQTRLFMEDDLTSHRKKTTCATFKVKFHLEALILGPSWDISELHNTLKYYKQKRDIKVPYLSSRLISIWNTSSSIITFMRVSWQGPTCHFSVHVSSSRCVEEAVEGKYKSHSLFFFFFFFITLAPFFTGLWWDRGANLGGVWRFMADRSVQAIRSRCPANEQSHREIQYLWSSSIKTHPRGRVSCSLTGWHRRTTRFIFIF